MAAALANRATWRSPSEFRPGW